MIKCKASAQVLTDFWIKSISKLQFSKNTGPDTMPCSGMPRQPYNAEPVFVLTPPPVLITTPAQ